MPRHVGARPVTIALALVAACAEDGTLGLEARPPTDAGVKTDAESAVDADADAAVDADAATPPVPEPPGEPKPGARLVPAFVEGRGGEVSRFLHFVDASANHEPCSLPFAATADSPMSCLPKAEGDLWFATDTCDEPVIEVTAVDYTVVRIAPTVPGGVSYPVRVGELLSPQPALLRYGQGVGACAEIANPPRAPVYAIDRTAALTPASGRLIEDRSEPRLLLRYFEGDDGSRVLHSIFDPLTQRRCAPGTTSAGLRCVPSSISTAQDTGLLDERCERLVVLEGHGLAVASVWRRNNEVYRFEPYPVGGDNTVVVGRRNRRGECEVSREEVGTRVPFVGVPYPESDWPPMTARRTGGDDLSADVAEALGGIRAEGERPFWPGEPPVLFETHGLACTPVWTAGRLRCLPSPPSSFRILGKAYADSACTERLLVFEGGDSPPTEVLVSEMAMLAGRHFLPEGGLVSVGSAHVGDAFERTSPDRPCQPYRARRPPEALFRMGPRVEDSRFPELRIVIGRP